jgi:radical SAM enzyme (TIGR01210 family)
LDTAYPEGASERDRWILGRRPARRAADAWRPWAFQVEPERAESGEVAPVATIFLVNRECPWRCVMCDLWQHALADTVPAGAIPAQIDHALGQMQAAGPPRQLKLYNSGSFFDPRAIPPADYPAIAERACRFERVIVECHPALVGQAAAQFRDLLVERASRLARAGGCPPKLEVAMGLETAHPQVLEKLNKRMTLEQFARAAGFLRQHDLALRVFILVQPPFLDPAEALHWTGKSLDFAFACGASVAVLIPTRGGNGALETLAAQGEFSPPKLAALEAALDDGIRLGRGRVLADLWDLERLADCPACFGRRAARLREMNLRQQTQPPVRCGRCGQTTIQP